MKRSREGDGAEDMTTMANCSMLLTGGDAGRGGGEDFGRVFTCKTCNRQFSSFQALGGHRPSHKEPRIFLMAGDDHLLLPKPKTHECSVCGLEFPTGQTLGGHMRKHRAATADDQEQSQPPPPPHVPTVNSRRVLCLDLNLTPLENKFVSGKFAPAVDCFF